MMDMRFAIVFAIVLILLQGNRLTLAHTFPYYIWPLAPEYSNLETTGNPTVAKGACVGSDTGHPSLDYNSSKLNGKALSYKEFTIDATIDFFEFTFLLFVSPVGEKGTFFHYEKQDPSTEYNTISGIVLSYTINDTNLYVIGNNASDVLVNITMQNDFQDGQWTPVTAQYVFEKDFEMWIGNNSMKLKLTDKRHLGVPGKIRVGGSFQPEYSPYNGRATCLQFYDSKLGDSFENALSNCLSTTWPAGIIDAVACEATKGYYEVVTRGGIPPSSTHSIANLTTSSRIRCANSCARANNACVSFAINRSNNVCWLYDVNDSLNLVPENGTDYYVSGTLLNCC